MKNSTWTIIGFVVLLCVVPVVCHIYSLTCKVASTPGRVLKRTLETDNVIHNYEWFHDVSKELEAKFKQVDQHKELLRTETDTAEKRKLRIEMVGIQQSCRTLVGQYNANSQKINRKIFKGRSAPRTIDPSECE